MAERNVKFAFWDSSKMDEIWNGMALSLATTHNLPVWSAVQSQKVLAFWISPLPDTMQELPVFN